MPIRRMMPITAMMLKSIPEMIKVNKAPTPADGRVERIVMGWT